MGATNLKAINLGGGLAIEYSQFKEESSRNYTLNEYANDVVYMLKTIASKKMSHSLISLSSLAASSPLRMRFWLPLCLSYFLKSTPKRS